jgi:hypothetical protein
MGDEKKGPDGPSMESMRLGELVHRLSNSIEAWMPRQTSFILILSDEAHAPCHHYFAGTTLPQVAIPALTKALALMESHGKGIQEIAEAMEEKNNGPRH